MLLKSIFVLLFYSYIGKAQGYVVLRTSGPTVRGSNVTLTAIIRNDFAGGEKKFVFHNIDRPEYARQILSSETVVNYTVELSKDKYEGGFYNFEVNVYSRNRYHSYLFSLYGSDRVIVHVTDLLNGYLRLTQNGIDRSHGNVIPNEPVNHIIKLSQEELQFVTKDNSYLVYWYLNCSLIARTREFSLVHTYDNVYNNYNLEVIVEVEDDRSSLDVATTKQDRLSSFKCVPIYKSRYTYGYYSTTIRGGATGSLSASFSRPSARLLKTRQYSTLPASTNRRTTPRSSQRRPWRTTPTSASRASYEKFWNTSPAPTSRSSRPQSKSEYTPWKNWRTTERIPFRNWPTPKSRPWSNWTVSKPIPWGSSPTSSFRSWNRFWRTRGTTEPRSWRSRSRTEPRAWESRSRTEPRGWKNRSRPGPSSWNNWGAPKPRTLNNKPNPNQRVGPVRFWQTSQTYNQTSIKPLLLKIDIDLLFNGTLNFDLSQIKGNLTIPNLKSTLIKKFIREYLVSYFKTKDKDFFNRFQT